MSRARPGVHSDRVHRLRAFLPLASRCRPTFLLRWAVLLLAGVPALAVPARADAGEGAATATNAAYVEILGNGLFYSLNYERHLRGEWWLRLGYEQFTESDEACLGGTRQRKVTMLPVMLNWIQGAGNHHLEAGVGILPSVGAGLGATATLGYRYQRPGGGLLFRVGLTPLYVRLPEYEDQPQEDDDLELGLLWLGISLGYAW